MKSRHPLAILALALSFATCANAQQPGKRDLSKGNTLYVVPYAHLDTQWRWAYPQVIREYIADTLNRNFALIEKYPNYVFNFSGSRRYEFMKEYYPAEYDRLKGYIKAGRWFPCGSSVDENDANVPSAESQIRHVLYGNNFFRKEFGVASEEFMLPDCFGFPYALPSILAHCGVKGFSTQKLTWGSAVGIPFKVGRWIGPDGKYVVAALDPGSYGADVTEDLSQNTSWLARIQNTGKQSGAFVDYHYYGTGDIGGSPRESAVQWVEKSIAGKGPVNVVSSHADSMFLSLTPAQIAKLPQYQGELLLTEHSAGSITSQAYMKRWNRKNEQLADAAERASVAAMWLGGAPYPAKRLYDAWDLVLGSQMHDMLPGTSIPKAYEFCWNDELLALNQFGSVTQDAVGSVTSAMDTRGRGVSVVVYNPLSTERSDPVDATINTPSATTPVTAFGPDGQPVPTQVLNWSEGKAKVLFIAHAPSTGFATYDLRQVALPIAGASQMLVSEREVSNGILRVRIDANGDVASVYDLLNKRETLKAPSRLEFQTHNPAQFPAWNMDWQDAQKPPRTVVSGPAKVRIVEKGLARVAIEVEREAEGSRFVQTIRLAAGGREVEVANKIDWQSKEAALKVSFPLTTGNPKATYELQLGTIDRGNNDPKKYEVPQHQWFDLTRPDGSYGVGILNDSKFGSDKPDDDTVRLTLIYTPGVRGGYQDQYTQDWGRHDITYAIAPHAGDWRTGNVSWAARRLNQPLKAFIVPQHDGRLGRTFSLFATNTNQVEISAIKKAENSSDVIVRLRELTGKPAANVKITTASGIASAREVDGQERPIGAANVAKGALTTSVSGYSLRSFAIKLVPAAARAVAVDSQPLPLTYDVDVASTDQNRSDGAFDPQGRSYSGDLLPGSLTVDGVKFTLGSTKDGAKNALVARGQSLAAPAGYTKAYILAAANGEVEAKLGGKTMVFHDWSGYVGSWDNRLWSENPGPNFSNYGQTVGLVPGFVKPGEVAWFSTHRHTPAGNAYYEFSYLYKYPVEVQNGQIKLPNDPRIRVFAVSAAKNAHDQALAAHPLYDNLADHRATGSPVASTIGDNFSDATTIVIASPLYHRPGSLKYTLDGSEVTATSPVYQGPFTISDTTTVKTAEFGANGEVLSRSSAVFEVHDTTAPKIVAASSLKTMGTARVQFSESVARSSAENPGNYKLSSGVAVTRARLMPDGRTVELGLASALPMGVSETVTVSGIADFAKSANVTNGATATLVERGAIFKAPPLESKTTKTFPVQNLPLKRSEPFTINLFTKVDKLPEHLTLIAGFGRATDGRAGTGRYFASFQQGINFWSSNNDTLSNVPLDLGKWQMLTATYDGKTMRLYKNGDLIAEQQVDLADDAGPVRVFPLDAWDRKRVYQGDIRDLTVWDQDLPPDAIKRMWQEFRP